MFYQKITGVMIENGIEVHGGKFTDHYIKMVGKNLGDVELVITETSICINRPKGLGSCKTRHYREETLPKRFNEVYMELKKVYEDIFTEDSTRKDFYIVLPELKQKILITNVISELEADEAFQFLTVGELFEHININYDVVNVEEYKEAKKSKFYIEHEKKGCKVEVEKM